MNAKILSFDEFLPSFLKTQEGIFFIFFNKAQRSFNRAGFLYEFIKRLWPDSRRAEQAQSCQKIRLACHLFLPFFKRDFAFLPFDKADNVYLIEINPRGGGDEISNKLVLLSTGYDYIKGMIDVALNHFAPPLLHHNQCAGIYYLCQQTQKRLPFFENSEKEPWLVEKHFDMSNGLYVSTGNYDRNGYLIYQWHTRVIIN